MPDAVLNGFQHHWEEAGSGPPLIMIHGAAASSKSLAAAIAALAAHFRVLAMDLRGMGQSARVTSLPPSAWSDDLGALIDHLGLAKTAIYGTSLGARIALRYAIDAPQRVSALILDNPIIANDSGGNAALNARMSDPANLPEENKARYRMMHGEGWEEVVRNYFSFRNEPALQAHLNLREGAQGLDIPTLLTRGDDRKDVVHPLPHVFELFNALPRSRMWVKPEGNCFATPEGYERVRSFVADAQG